MTSSAWSSAIAVPLYDRQSSQHATFALSLPEKARDLDNSAQTWQLQVSLRVRARANPSATRNAANVMQEITLDRQYRISLAPHWKPACRGDEPHEISSIYSKSIDAFEQVGQPLCKFVSWRGK